MLQVALSGAEEEANAIIYPGDDEPLIGGPKAYHPVGTKAVAEEDYLPFLHLPDRLLQALSQKVRGTVQPMLQETAGKSSTVDFVDLIVNRLTGDYVGLTLSQRGLSHPFHKQKKYLAPSQPTSGKSAQMALENRRLLITKSQLWQFFFLRSGLRWTALQRLPRRSARLFSLDKEASLLYQKMPNSLVKLTLPIL
jgi:hypothetical protein